MRGDLPQREAGRRGSPDSAGGGGPEGWPVTEAKRAGPGRAQESWPRTPPDPPMLGATPPSGPASMHLPPSRPDLTGTKCCFPPYRGIPAAPPPPHQGTLYNFLNIKAPRPDRSLCLVSLNLHPILGGGGCLGRGERAPPSGSHSLVTFPPAASQAGSSPSPAALAASPQTRHSRGHLVCPARHQPVPRVAWCSGTHLCRTIRTPTPPTACHGTQLAATGVHDPRHPEKHAQTHTDLRGHRHLCLGGSRDKPPRLPPPPGGAPGWPWGGVDGATMGEELRCWCALGHCTRVCMCARVCDT